MAPHCPPFEQCGKQKFSENPKRRKNAVYSQPGFCQFQNIPVTRRMVNFPARRQHYFQNGGCTIWNHQTKYPCRNTWNFNTGQSICGSKVCSASRTIEECSFKSVHAAGFPDALFPQPAAPRSRNVTAPGQHASLLKIPFILTTAPWFPHWFKQKSRLLAPCYGIWKSSKNFFKPSNP